MRTFALLAALAAPAGAQDAPQALVGATLVEADRSVEDSVVVVDGARISCAGSRADCSIPEDARVTDLSGRFITPGLIDGHVHFSQTGWLDGRLANLGALYPADELHAGLRAQPDRWHQAYLCSGITSVFDVGGPPWTVTDTQGDALERANRVNVRAAGPLITYATAALPGDGGETFVPMESEAQIRDEIARIKANGSAAIKLWYLDPSEERQDELDALVLTTGRLAREAGLPLIVHATELRNAKVALKAGASMLVHSVWDRAVDAEFLDLLLDNGAYYAPTIVVMRKWTEALDALAIRQVPDVDDPNRCVDQALLDRIAESPTVAERLGGVSAPASKPMLQRAYESGLQEGMARANLIAVHEAGGRIVLSTDAGNPLTVHGPSILWEMEVMEAAGMLPIEILRAGTIVAANGMGMGDDVGTLEAGKVADLLVLSEDPRETVSAFRALTHVMRAGELKTQEELQVR